MSDTAHLDEKGCNRLAAKVIILALRDARNGDTSAETWFTSSQQADIFMDGLGLCVDRRTVIEKVKTGKFKLTL